MHLSLKKHHRRQESRTRFGTRLGKVGAKISHLDNPSRAKSLSADGTSRAWVPLAEVLVTLPLADWWIQINWSTMLGGCVTGRWDSWRIWLKSSCAATEQNHKPGSATYKALFVPSNRVGSKLKKLPKQNKKYCSCRTEWTSFGRLPWEILHTGNYLATEPSIVFSLPSGTIGM